VAGNAEDDEDDEDDKDDVDVEDSVAVGNVRLCE
jgi:hypothetical protein